MLSYDKTISLIPIGFVYLSSPCSSLVFVTYPTRCFSTLSTPLWHLTFIRLLGDPQTLPLFGLKYNDVR
ncbi:hypothetical protein P691DRAFT_805279 [Macrolepiota fuliginosa MF-IS2]|uniref:Uncharacterized protein n=1 Tax=Macrolepiota fuliginosa MF-IS2 TaxID=1400762 RepID=A0A9P5X6Z0_9AGAR|nr:hypothetical protein P691DRAFT_805279 [Macrolepiota fuliginosa MF-IS2]